MAIVKCKECKGRVSNKAEACPHCGVIIKRGKYGWGTVILTFVIIVVWVKACDSIGSSVSGSAPAASDAVCMQDLQCWGNRNNSAADAYCQKPIERLAKHSIEWTDGAFALKFSRFRWFVASKGEITYIGDEAKFQNGFGAWTHYIYECDFNPKTNQVINVRARPGRL